MFLSRTALGKASLRPESATWRHQWLDFSRLTFCLVCSYQSLGTCVWGFLCSPSTLPDFSLLTLAVFLTANYICDPVLLNKHEWHQSSTHARHLPSPNYCFYFIVLTSRGFVYLNSRFLYLSSTVLPLNYMTVGTVIPVSLGHQLSLYFTTDVNYWKWEWYGCNIWYPIDLQRSIRWTEWLWCYAFPPSQLMGIIPEAATG